MINIILFGGPGSGKGTQAKKLANYLNLTHVSTGDLFRDHLKNNTLIGKKIKFYVEKGDLVPDDITFLILNNKIKNNKFKGFIFDGYPRTLKQAKYLNILLKNLKSSILIIILLNVPDHLLINRLLKRGEIDKRTDDINIKIIKNRIKEYNKKKNEILNFFIKNKNKLIEIEGIESIEKITEKILKEINQYIQLN